MASTESTYTGTHHGTRPLLVFSPTTAATVQCPSGVIAIVATLHAFARSGAFWRSADRAFGLPRFRPPAQPARPPTHPHPPTHPRSVSATKKKAKIQAVKAMENKAWIGTDDDPWMQALML